MIPDIKTEISDDYPSWSATSSVLDSSLWQVIKTEPPTVSNIPGNPLDLSFPKSLHQNTSFYVHYGDGRVHLDNGMRLKCRICSGIFISSYKFQLHRVLGPCGYMAIPRIHPERVVKLGPRPYSCSLCGRKYKFFGHLYNHQVKRCPRRYVSNNWVVRIWTPIFKFVYFYFFQMLKKNMAKLYFSQFFASISFPIFHCILPFISFHFTFSHYTTYIEPRNLVSSAVFLFKTGFWHFERNK